MVDNKDKPKKFLLKSIVVIVAIYGSFEIYDRSSFKNKINGIFSNRFNISLL